MQQRQLVYVIMVGIVVSIPMMRETETRMSIKTSLCAIVTITSIVVKFQAMMAMMLTKKTMSLIQRKMTRMRSSTRSNVNPFMWIRAKRR